MLALIEAPEIVLKNGVVLVLLKIDGGDFVDDEDDKVVVVVVVVAAVVVVVVVDAVRLPLKNWW